ncbi:MAG: MBL fold metallo-hydrolase [Actinomycetota bacterium]
MPNWRYAGFPTAKVYEDVDGKKGRKAVESLLWGDMFDLLDDSGDGDFVRVRCRTGEGAKLVEGWMKRDDVLEHPLLEVTFIDIGQGDGCVVYTPGDDGVEETRKMMVIDAGEHDNMSRYLRWRLFYPSERRPQHLHAAVITHPDSDHYKGFGKVFGLKGVTFEHVYHNGLVERKGDRTLGPLAEGNPKVHTDLVKTERRLKTILDADAIKPGRKLYPDMLRKAMNEGAFNSFRMLCADDEFMPGFGPDDDITIEVLGPIVETNDAGKTGLRRIKNDGMTKNGHSVVFRLTYGNVRVLLGGDLNIPSEELLLETIVGRPLPHGNKREREKFIAEARAQLEVDVAKSCHHGSADFSSLFLECVNPIATVISSGDAEKHSHPRAETLGTIGACSRGERPLIYSTELARSVKEKVRDPRKERRELKALHKEAITAAKEGTPAERRKAEAKFRKAVDATIERTVQTYGAIYLRTDGERAVIGHRYESNSPSKTWDLCELLPDDDGRLHFTTKH